MDKITLSLIGAPVAYLIMIVAGTCSLIGFFKQSFFLGMILHPSSVVKQKQYYRLISADFVHNDFSHLLFNEISLFLFCTTLEEYLNKHSPNGNWQFLFIYCFSQVAGAGITTLRHRNDFNFSSAGASGSILGCLMSFMILQPNKTGLFIPGVGGIKNLYIALFYILALILFQRKTNNKLLNHELHFWGAIGGIIATYILFPQIL
jgi:membrane associated rhomboid family serine protease